MHALLNLVLIDLYECDQDRLTDLDLIRGAMLKAAEIMGADIRGHSFHTFEPWGISGTVTIAESHLAVHTWPEYYFASVTFETCGQRMDHEKAYEYLVHFFKSRRPQIDRQKRGFMELKAEAYAYGHEAG